MKANGSKPLYERIYDMVRKIPPGKVATYGQIAMLVGGCSARIVGYAMAALRDSQYADVPWQRVINARGQISMHGIGSNVQRMMLEEEDIVFDSRGRIDLNFYRWEELL
ncbi:MAG: MGMT family protein [Chloroflexota bacterium]